MVDVSEEEVTNRGNYIWFVGHGKCIRMKLFATVAATVKNAKDRLFFK